MPVKTAQLATLVEVRQITYKKSTEETLEQDEDYQAQECPNEKEKTEDISK